jgi:mutator protein MutT
MNDLSNPFLRRLRDNIQSLPADQLSIAGFRSAAVVVPLIQTGAGWELIFTVRSKQLSNHAGQVSFPGGKVDEGETLEQAAVRELQEEVGLNVTQILGQLHSHPSPAKFVVTPIVCELDWPQEMMVNPAEVDEVFTASLDQLSKLKPRIETRSIQHDTRDIRFYDYKRWTIWGLTGNIIHDLVQLSR